MNPKPSLVQALVLHYIANDEVWFDVTSGRWHSVYGKNEISLQMSILHRDGYITISDEPIPKPGLTAAGREVLRRRPYAELVEKLNRD